MGGERESDGEMEMGSGVDILASDWPVGVCDFRFGMKAWWLLWGVVGVFCKEQKG